ncbi:MAG: restriction endonuclease [Bacteroidetes bacterium]|nr:MAG: restriction endonuclease [Bacteroidota bacterium]
MSKIEEAKQILKALGLPQKQQNDRSALTLLALCNLKQDDHWSMAKAVSMSVVGSKKNPKYGGILRFIAEHYEKLYAENSRETIRRQTLHQFIQAGIVNHNPENPDLPTNSKDNHYRLSPEALRVIRSFSSANWETEVAHFRQMLGSLQEKYRKRRELRKNRIQLSDGTELAFSPGRHNQLQIAVIEQFTPRFAPGSKLLYACDTADKDLYIDHESLEKLGIAIDQHTKLT